MFSITSWKLKICSTEFELLNSNFSENRVAIPSQYHFAVSQGAMKHPEIFFQEVRRHQIFYQHSIQIHL